VSCTSTITHQSDGHLYGFDLATNSRLYRTPVTRIENIEEPFAPGKDVHFCPGAGGGDEWNSPGYAGKIESRLAQSLRRDRAEIDAAAAEDSLSLDDRDPLVELGALDGGATARPARNQSPRDRNRTRPRPCPPLFTRARSAVEECAEREPLGRQSGDSAPLLPGAAA
jgi:hypothetical protein